jgi:hypothetical protein
LGGPSQEFWGKQAETLRNSQSWLICGQVGDPLRQVFSRQTEGSGSAYTRGVRIAWTAGALFVAFLGFRSSGLAHDSKPPASGPAAAAVEGHRLFLAGQFAKAAAKLETAVGSASDPEVLFELAVCYERLDRDSEAIAEFHAYQGFPVALRVREAAQHIKAIESKQPGPAESLRPRRLVVPTRIEGGNCVRDCGKAPSPFCGSPGVKMQRPCAVRFSCLRSCPGARLEPGSCNTVPSSPTQECVNE